MAVNLIYKSLPTVALRGLVVFPGMKLHFEVGREKSIAAIRAAMNENQRVFLVAQRSVADDDPGEDALFRTGVIASIKQVVKAPDSDNVRVLIEGESIVSIARERGVTEGAVRKTVRKIRAASAADEELQRICTR